MNAKVQSPPVQPPRKDAKTELNAEAWARWRAEARRGRGEEGQRQGQWQRKVAASASVGRDRGSSKAASLTRPGSRLRVEEAPGDGAHLVEGVEYVCGTSSFDDAGMSWKPEMAVYFVGRSVGSSPEVLPVPS